MKTSSPKLKLNAMALKLNGVSWIIILSFLTTLLFVYVFVKTNSKIVQEGFESNSDNNTDSISQSSSESKCQKIPGLNGVYCDAKQTEKPLDFLYGASSSMTCEGSGLTKNGGNVCLDKKQYELLTTRGGNALAN